MDRRASDRVSVDVTALCRVPATPHRVTVLDLSRTGCKVALKDIHVTPGTTVHIDFAAAPSVSGQVAWSRPGSAGVHFHRRLNTDLAVRYGIEEAPSPVEAIAEVTPKASGGLQHWIRAVFGFSKR